MADRVLTNALMQRDKYAAEINQKNQEIEAIRKDLGAVETFIANWYKFAGLGADSGGGADSNSGVDKSYTQDIQPIAAQGTLLAASEPTHKNPPRQEVGRAAWEVMTQLQRPVPRAELFKELAQRGIEIRGKDPEMVLSTMVWRLQEHFVRLPKFGYWKRSHEWQPANYVPGQTVEQDEEDMRIQASSLFGGEPSED
jgi:hypothetical protein